MNSGCSVVNKTASDIHQSNSGHYHHNYQGRSSKQGDWQLLKKAPSVLRGFLDFILTENQYSG